MSMPKPIADFQTYLTAAMSPAATTFTIFDVTDDSGTSLDGKTVWFVIDSERVLATVVAATKTCTVVLRGVDPNVSTEEVTALKVQHEKGAPVRITDAHYLLQATEMLSGDIDLQGVPKLPATRTLTLARQVVDKAYADSLAIASLPDFAVSDAGGITININAGTLVTFDGTIEYAGVAGQALTDNATNYVQLTQLGALSINTTGWTVGYVPLAKVVTLTGDITTLTISRGLITVPVDDREITDDYLYGATIAAGNLLYLDTATAKWKLASGAAAATATGILGVALDAGVDTDAGKRVQTSGVVTGLSGLTVGYVFVSDTPGAASATAGTYKKIIGYAPNTTTLVMIPTTSAAQIEGSNAATTLANLNEAMTFFNTTDITGAEAQTLTGGANSDASTLHYHPATLNAQYDESMSQTGGPDQTLDLMSYTLPANTLTSTSGLRITAVYQLSASGSGTRQATMRFFWDGTQFATHQITGNTTFFYKAVIEIRNYDATNLQDIMTTVLSEGSPSPQVTLVEHDTDNADTTGAVIFKLQGFVDSDTSSSASIAVKSMVIERI
jgi:hypothetical protein